MTDSSVNNGQTVNNLDVTTGNFVDVMPGGTATNTIIENGGELAVEGTNDTFGLGPVLGLVMPGGVANGVTVNNGGLLDLRSLNSSASNIVLNGGTLQIDNTATVTGSLTFAGSIAASVLLVSGDPNFKPTIKGFSASSSIEDHGELFSGATLKTVVSGGNTIATITGSETDTFTFAGTPQLKLAEGTGDDGDGNGDAIIVTTNTTTTFGAKTQDAAQVSQVSTPAHGDTVSALQAGHATSPALSFLSHPQAAAGSPAGLGVSDAAMATTKIAAAAQTTASIAHAMTVSQGHDLDRSMLGALPKPTGLNSVEPRATIGGALHVALAPVLPTLTPHLG